MTYSKQQKNQTKNMYHINILPFSLHKGLGKHARFDDNGVLQSRIPYNNFFSYHATAISSFAITTDDTNKMYDQLDWLSENMCSDGSIKHYFKIISYDGINRSWTGGLAQGLMISAFLRAYILDNDKKFLKLAEMAYNGLICHAIDIDTDGYTWIMEYPGVSSILNGYIYSMFGVYDLMINDDSKKIKSSCESLWFECNKCITDKLPLYDLGGWSIYDKVYNYPATDFYHRIHMKQLHRLYELTGNPIYNMYALKWAESYNGIIKNYYKFTKMLMQLKINGIFTMYSKWRKHKKWKNQK